MFAKASRLKLRFETPKGLITVEDLWDLPLTSNTGKANLDDIATSLHHALKNDNISFVVKEQKPDEVAQIKFDIVIHIINTRISENDAANLARVNREKKQQILAIINQKESETLASSSIDDLRKLLESM